MPSYQEKYVGLHTSLLEALGEDTERASLSANALIKAKEYAHRQSMAKSSLYLTMRDSINRTNAIRAEHGQFRELKIPESLTVSGTLEHANQLIAILTARLELVSMIADQEHDMRKQCEETFLTIIPEIVSEDEHVVQHQELDMSDTLHAPMGDFRTENVKELPWALERIDEAEPVSKQLISESPTARENTQVPESNLMNTSDIRRIARKPARSVSSVRMGPSASIHRRPAITPRRGGTPNLERVARGRALSPSSPLRATGRSESMIRSTENIERSDILRRRSAEH